VADTWNSRIQKLSPSGEPLQQIPVPTGWESQNVSNKAYLTVDRQGRIFATFPEQGRVLGFAPDGQQIADLSLPGNASPIGIGVAGDGRLLVADARNNLIDSLPRP
jgi:sugar lactone lactonase YvrE